ncbi:hypothetical protein VNO80_01430 [Phaseolus coccineus]|uniref:Uncharacterized protein n=1 Tax=Phaseolus coccineus TaxID=3886 RepID=A0AAN9RSS7_PHACN
MAKETFFFTNFSHEFLERDMWKVNKPMFSKMEAPRIASAVVRKPVRANNVWRLKAQQRSFSQVVKNGCELFSQKVSDVSTVSF